MNNYYSPVQAALIDKDNRQMYLGGLPMSGELESIRDIISASGTIAVTAAAQDIDSMALGGGEFTIDQATSPPSGTLNFSWLGSRFFNGYTLVAVSAGTLALAASNTNYIQVDRTGTVSSNTSGFTAGKLPLWIVITGVSSWTLANVESQKPHLCLIGTAGVTGVMLSTAAATKEEHVQLGTVSATATFLVMAPNIAAALNGAKLINSAAIAASDTNYWVVTIVNLGAAGAGTTQMLAPNPQNTTHATGGAAIAANVVTSLVLNGTSSNLNTNPNDVLAITFTLTGAPGSLTEAAVRLDFSFAG